MFVQLMAFGIAIILSYMAYRITKHWTDYLFVIGISSITLAAIIAIVLIELGI